MLELFGDIVGRISEAHSENVLVFKSSTSWAIYQLLGNGYVRIDDLFRNKNPSEFLFFDRSRRLVGVVNCEICTILCIPEDGCPGKTGPQGNPGLPGLNGSPGTPGIPGSNGSPGKSGNPGARGNPGKEGLRGLLGLPGTDGSNGPSGAPGLPGLSGNPGPSGARGISGISGIPGPSGYRGLSGERGLQGPSGLSGIPGSPGVSGPSGYPGASGSQGAQGQKGLPGTEGVPGSDGLPGKRGPPGNQGLRGQTGDSGLEGPTGNRGPDGKRGPPGQRGVPGGEGEPGDRGFSGPVGLRGPPGKQGPSGSPGLPGSNGSRGPPGLPGSGGKEGLPGLRGPSGSPGSPGARGPSGAPGLSGTPGLSGNPGVSGIQGLSGISGISGQMGLSGPSGSPGAAGPSSNFGFVFNPSNDQLGAYTENPANSGTEIIFNSSFTNGVGFDNSLVIQTPGFYRARYSVNPVSTNTNLGGFQYNSITNPPAFNTGTVLSFQLLKNGYPIPGSQSFENLYLTTNGEQMTGMATFQAQAGDIIQVANNITGPANLDFPPSTYSTIPKIVNVNSNLVDNFSNTNSITITPTPGNSLYICAQGGEGSDSPNLLESVYDGINSYSRAVTESGAPYIANSDIWYSDNIVLNSQNNLTIEITYQYDTYSSLVVVEVQGADSSGSLKGTASLDISINTGMGISGNSYDVNLNPSLSINNLGLISIACNSFGSEPTLDPQPGTGLIFENISQHGTWGVGTTNTNNPDSLSVVVDITNETNTGINATAVSIKGAIKTVNNPVGSASLDLTLLL